MRKFTKKQLMEIKGTIDLDFSEFTDKMDNGVDKMTNAVTDALKELDETLKTLEKPSASATSLQSSVTTTTTSPTSLGENQHRINKHLFERLINEGQI